MLLNHAFNNLFETADVPTTHTFGKGFSGFSLLDQHVDLVRIAGCGQSHSPSLRHSPRHCRRVASRRTARRSQLGPPPSTASIG